MNAHKNIFKSEIFLFLRAIIDSSTFTKNDFNIQYFFKIFKYEHAILFD